MLSLVILTASVFEILCGKTDGQTDKETIAGGYPCRLLSVAWVTTTHNHSLTPLTVIRPHRMHTVPRMWPIVTDVARSVVCVSVRWSHCLSSSFFLLSREMLPSALKPLVGPRRKLVTLMYFEKWLNRSRCCSWC